MEKKQKNLEKKIGMLLLQIKNSPPQEDNRVRHEMLKELIEEHYNLTGEYYKTR